MLSGNSMMGLASMLALVFGMASTAFGANGGNLILGSLNNAATAITRLTGSVSGGPALHVVNTDTAPGSKALQLNVAQGKPPLAVNSAAGRATNLNADKVDGLDSASFVQGGGQASQGIRTIANGTSQTVLTTSNPNITLGFECSGDSGGSIHTTNSGSEPLRGFIDYSTSNSSPTILPFELPGLNSSFVMGAVPTGVHWTIQVQGTNVATIEGHSYSRDNVCHVQSQALVTR